ncbi:MAG TPA: c-type cytochrome, partial [Pirellulales bacterium]|nr:c-type cytochrome [Pirellulales bacterium]
MRMRPGGNSQCGPAALGRVRLIDPIHGRGRPCYIARLALRMLILAAACLLASAGFGAEEDDEEELPDFRPGLVARYVGADGVGHERRDETVQFAWANRSPDARLPPGEFSATWSGRLFTIAPGEYRLRVHAAGAVQLKLAGQTLLDESAAEPRWLAAQPVKLEYGYHALEVAYGATGDAPQIGLYWSGPQFQLEPVPAWHLFHEPQAAPDERFAQGQLLARALRCGACHEIPGEQTPLAAPELTHLAGNLSRTWLIEWLKHPQHDGRAGGVSPLVNDASLNGAPSDEAPPRRMPRFDLAAGEAETIAEYLLDRSQPPPPDAAPTTKSKKPAGAKGRPPKSVDSKAGEALFETLGCLACHRQGELGVSGLFGGGDLSQIAAKRPAGFFLRWLEDPASINPAHRMPVFKLADEERADLAAYLATLGAAAGKTNLASKGNLEPGTRNQERPKQSAQQMLESYRCTACHALPSGDPKKPKLLPPLDANSNWRSSCLDRPDRATRRPAYSLSPAQRAALEQYFRELPKRREAAPLDGRFVLAERNCLACHARGLSPGIAGHVERLAQARPELAPILASLTPPALSGVGDKLHNEALAAAILLKQPPLRPWLAVRMPRFDLDDEEMRALIEHFVSSDRIPEPPDSEAATAATDPALAVAGSRLVTSDGFGCTSCHQIGKSLPVKVAPAAHGTDLSLAGKRIRRAWYDRWVRNPARIVPRMEMPSIQLPVRGVLGERLDDQLAAVWQALNTPGFNPPQPNPIRVVRARNLPGESEPATALTDVLEIEGRPFVKPFVVGLANRHNVLIDLETNRLAAWWIGDAARQRTRGKSWYWEAGGTPIVPAAAPASDNELGVLRDGKQLVSSGIGQFAAELDAFELVPGGMSLEYRLQYSVLPLPKGEGTTTLAVKQIVTALASDDGQPSGFRRRLEIRGAEAGDRIRLHVAPGGAAAAKVSGNTAILAGGPGRTELRMTSAASGKLSLDGGALWIILPPAETNRPIVCEL